MGYALNKIEQLEIEIEELKKMNNVELKGEVA
jgi:predicted RNase H-like nuclease (RuvC/YqgF family)